MSPPITGLHHVTAIAVDPRRNADFYTRVLGLRLVKHTVNFDDQETHHLYYGDETGRPGTIVTFFVRPDDRRGQPGTRQVMCVRFSVPPESLDVWRRRLVLEGVTVSDGPAWCDARALSFHDPDGLKLDLVGAPDTPDGARPSHGPLSRHAIRGLHSIELTVPALTPTCTLLTDVMKLNETHSQPQLRRFAAAGHGPGLFVDVRADTELAEGSIGAGSVHHVAFRVGDATQQRTWQQRLRTAGLEVTDVKDRKYFRSIYFCEPNGIRFEVATDGPGFTVDEVPLELGRRLQLPASLEPKRKELESRFSSLPTSSA